MIKGLPRIKDGSNTPVVVMSSIQFVWEFIRIKINPFIAQWRAVVVVKFLWVWITFPVRQISSILKMRRGSGAVTEYVLRIWGSRCQTAKIASETTIDPTTVERFKNVFEGKILTWLSRPRSSSMMKNRMAHRVGRGIMDTALG